MVERKLAGVSGGRSDSRSETAQLSLILLSSNSAASSPAWTKSRYP